MWLLDTVTISEPTKSRAAEPVISWLGEQPGDVLHTSVLCIGEIRRGIERLEPGGRRTRLRAWLEQDLPAWFGARILPVDINVAQLWGELTAVSGRTVPAIDGLIAATAMHHRLTVVTRNAADFEALHVPVFNPWDD
ncbi:MAG: type II toxin-antitoxin system VapC family toxin [Hyphomonadaceae bacterium]|nr:type II toxin-antitoxin system VapC family toxin [Hyphomonadaceae bacterium]